MYACVIFCSDWNGSKRGHVYKFLRSQGFESTYDTAHQYTDNDAHKVGYSGYQFSTHWIAELTPCLSAQCISFSDCRFLLYLLQWVSHRNHRGNICGVDFIWLCNPNKSRKPLKTSWCEAVFGILRVSISFTQISSNIVLLFFFLLYNPLAHKLRADSSMQVDIN